VRRFEKNLIVLYETSSLEVARRLHLRNSFAEKCENRTTSVVFEYAASSKSIAWTQAHRHGVVERPHRTVK
jgi:hypothetical protein